MIQIIGAHIHMQILYREKKQTFTENRRDRDRENARERETERYCKPGLTDNRR